jgi:hypothetical protein
MPYYISPPPQNPLSRILAGIVAVIAVIAAFTIGFVALLIIGGLGLIAGLIIWARLAWIRHRLQKSGVQTASPKASGQVIDAEYTVISEDDD